MSEKPDNAGIEFCEPFEGKGFRPPVSGILLDVSVVDFHGRTRTQFTMRRKDGSCFRFLSQLDLDELILPEHVGQFFVVKLDPFYVRPRYCVWRSGDESWHEGQFPRRLNQ
jgi:hypothetical protein